MLIDMPRADGNQLGEHFARHRDNQSIHPLHSNQASAIRVRAYLGLHQQRLLRSSAENAANRIETVTKVTATCMPNHPTVIGSLRFSCASSDKLRIYGEGNCRKCKLPPLHESHPTKTCRTNHSYECYSVTGTLLTTPTTNQFHRTRNK